MRVLLIGADTSLGLALESHLQRWGRHELETVSFSASRWKSERHAKKAVRRARPDIIVDARIQGAVDSGEQLFDLDVDRCLWLAKVCQRSEAAYLLLSSARVFAGDQERPYNEQDEPDSEETVGGMLRRSEELVRERCENHVILRLGPVFAHRGRNILTHMLDQLMQGGELGLDTGLRGCPVAAPDAARVVSGMLDQLGAGAEARGNFHYCSADATNCYEFAEVLLASASQFQEFGPGAVALREREAGHKLSRRLDCNRLRNTFAIKQVPWRGYVADTVKLYFEQLQNSEH
ncbi:sugar nucleotide-binding protein [Parahaliea mediterranea]|uniref:dTDP-4-dehydrorhamnose reductase n=1 Tax=Parahaliea mediterranea TaxID=651086 RepID=A0A939DB45_9GAMM|nr:sugar nucleotide-binding protein [Parahaliea mediterranea]